jgi:hypothetical protein
MVGSGNGGVMAKQNCGKCCFGGTEYCTPRIRGACDCTKDFSERVLKPSLGEKIEEKVQEFNPEECRNSQKKVQKLTKKVQEFQHLFI